MADNCKLLARIKTLEKNEANMNERLSDSERKRADQEQKIAMLEMQLVSAQKKENLLTAELQKMRALRK